MSQMVKCPECGGKLEKGYIITPAVRWSKRKHAQFAFGQELVVPWKITAIPNVEASRCTKCRLILFHYPIPLVEVTPPSFLKTCVKCHQEIPVASDYCPRCGAEQKRGANHERR